MKTPNERWEATYQQKTELIVDWTKNQNFFNLERINLLHAHHVHSWVKAKLKLAVSDASCMPAMFILE
jgi:hypothetical protein